MKLLTMLFFIEFLFQRARTSLVIQNIRMKLPAVKLRAENLSKKDKCLLLRKNENKYIIFIGCSIISMANILKQYCIS